LTIGKLSPVLKDNMLVQLTMVSTGPKNRANQAPVHDLRVHGSVGVEITPRFFGAIAASLRRISMRFQF
jgi:hypothetical protein